VQIAILGPLEVRDDAGDLVEVAGRGCAPCSAGWSWTLSRLAVDAGRPVSVAVLVDAVWGEQPPAGENNALQTLVSRLRRALGDTGTIVQSGAASPVATGSKDSRRVQSAT
jgi:DNA-binding SARP family transcriptional activator